MIQKIFYNVHVIACLLVFIPSVCISQDTIIDPVDPDLYCIDVNNKLFGEILIIDSNSIETIKGRAVISLTLENFETDTINIINPSLGCIFLSHPIRTKIFPDNKDHKYYEDMLIPLVKKFRCWELGVNKKKYLKRMIFVPFTIIGKEGNIPN
ncbi:MAG: hypothetical protein H6Q15_916 [Bacteroidetes bacterium]|nr:hypothetical protein [Bacteroidota bacterium]